MSKESELLAAAKILASTSRTWTDFSNSLFGSENGLVPKVYSTREERRQFMKTREYQAIKDLMDEMIERTGLVEGATSRERYVCCFCRQPFNNTTSFDSHICRG